MPPGIVLRCLIAFRNSESRSFCRNSAPDGAELLAQAVHLREQHAQARRVDPGAGAEGRELRHLPLEILEHLAAEVAARRDRQDLEQRIDRGARRPRIGARVVMHGLVIQEVEAQEIAHPLVERHLVDDRAPGRVRRGHQCFARVHGSVFCASLSRRHNPTDTLV